MSVKEKSGDLRPASKKSEMTLTLQGLKNDMVAATIQHELLKVLLQTKARA